MFVSLRANCYKFCLMHSIWTNTTFGTENTVNPSKCSTEMIRNEINLFFFVFLFIFWKENVHPAIALMHAWNKIVRQYSQHPNFSNIKISQYIRTLFLYQYYVIILFVARFQFKILSLNSLLFVFKYNKKSKFL